MHTLLACVYVHTLCPLTHNACVSKAPALHTLQDDDDDSDAEEQGGSKEGSEEEEEQQAGKRSGKDEGFLDGILGSGDSDSEGESEDADAEDEEEEGEHHRCVCVCQTLACTSTLADANHETQTHLHLVALPTGACCSQCSARTPSQKQHARRGHSKWWMKLTPSLSTT